MPPLKFEIYSLPDLIERNGALWFKLKLDDKGKLKPHVWQEPVDEALIQSVVNDASLTTHPDRTTRLHELSGRDRSSCREALRVGRWHSSDNAYLPISPEDFKRQVHEPVRSGARFWFYRHRLVKVVGDAPSEDLPLLVQHHVLSHEQALSKMRREVEAFENFEKLSSGSSREPIPRSVRLFVWQRDGGRCVECGGKVGLEFDHVIPLAKGGGNSERNIQLLCEKCNRSKGTAI